MVALGLLATAVALFCIFALIPSQRRNPSGIPNPIDPAHRDAVTVDEAGNNAVPPRRSVADEGAFQLVEASSGMQTDEGANGNGNGNGYPAIYGVKVLGMSDHDWSAFTQGFFHERACEGGGGPCEEYILESTGLYGRSSVRRVDLESGAVLSKTDAPSGRIFGEGLTRWKDELLQLTWKSNEVLVYKHDDLSFVETRHSDLSDGWGLTNDSSHLIATDGSSKVYFLDPVTLRTDRQVTVKDGDSEVRYLNELEFIGGQVWANIWGKNCIARVDPEDGKVLGWIDVEDLVLSEQARGKVLGNYNQDVVNGIAFDAETKRIWLTGKLWTTVYEVEVVEEPQADLQKILQMRAKCIR